MENLNSIQTNNEVKISTSLDGSNFSVEMETGTAKTYLYLRTIYSAFISLDSGVESQFAKDCERSDQIKFYFKLPKWFKIPKPIRNYNPDWATVFEDDKKIYFVAETKDTGTTMVDLTKLIADEQMKIKCGKAHFN